MLSTKGTFHNNSNGLPSSPLRTTQSDFFDYLQLGTVKKVIETKPCSVMIRGSKCSICKREFKCITDTHKHVLKKHKYLKRKSDDKLVRIKLKIGKETFCDNTISKKFLMTPERGSRPIAIESSSDPQPLQLSNIRCPRPPQSVSQNLLAKLSVPLSSALFDIQSLDENGKYINGRISKERNTTPSLADQDPMFSPSRIEDSSLHAGSSSDTENSVVYVSDVEVDLSEFYEDVKPIIDVDSDVEDAETVIMANNLGDDSLDINISDLDDMTPADLEALGKTCEDMDMADMYTKLGMTGNGFDSLEHFCRTLAGTKIAELDPILASQEVEGELVEAETRKRPSDTGSVRPDASESKIARKSSIESETSHSEHRERGSTRKRRRKKTKTIKLDEKLEELKEMDEMIRQIVEADARKNAKKVEAANRNSETVRRSSRNTESTRSESSEDAASQRIGIRLRKTQISTNQSPDSTNLWQAEAIQTHPEHSDPIDEMPVPPQVIETISDDLQIIETHLTNPKIAESVPMRKTSENVSANLETNEKDVNANILQVLDDLEPCEDLDVSRIRYRSLEDVEKVRQRLQASDNDFVDLTETDDVGGGLEASEISFRLSVPNLGDKPESPVSKDEDVIIIEDDEEEESLPQLENAIIGAILKFKEDHKVGSNSPPSKFNYQLKKVLEKLEVTIVTPSLIKEEIE